MTDETIVAVYDTSAHAEAAVASLKTAGVPSDAISLHSSTEGMSTTAGGAAPVREEGFWASLFGGSPDHDTAIYDRSVAGGSTVVSVKTPASYVTRVLEILESHNPSDIDEAGASSGMTQTTTTTTQPIAAAAMPVKAPVAAPMGTMAARSTDDSGKLQLSEESLAVGKRVVNRGGTRIRRFVVETPVEESLSLHSEKVVLERHPVTDGRPVTDGFSDKTIEMTETAEEAVVSKTARVYEEVGLRKEVSDRVETVRDTVRKEEVEVEQVPGTATTSTVTPVTTKTATTDPKLSPKV
ncbi:MAG: YsnF/AvaK domain-containing protein [Janthinobacterium lividum]